VIHYNNFISRLAQNQTFTMEKMIARCGNCLMMTVTLSLILKSLIKVNEINQCLPLSP
jgi:hypothetical protein